MFKRRFGFHIAALLAVAFLPIAAACAGEAAEVERNQEAAAVVPAGHERVRFQVDDMTCGGCAVATRTALRKLPGVQDAGASYNDETAAGSAWAVYDPQKVSVEEMIAAIKELGYTATVVEPNNA